VRPPRRYAIVVSSQAKIPARAPASIDMLETVMRPSIESEWKALPPNSITEPVPPAVPILPITASTRSLAVTPRGQHALGADQERLRLLLHQALGGEHVLDLGSADAERERREAPWVLVWLSPQTTVMPGSVAPCSGPIT
jgi:hypothetical protein